MTTPESAVGAKVIPIGVPSLAPREDATTGKWDGGYWRQNKQGRRVFYIYKKVGGKLYEISTRATRESAALEHFKRFQADPAGYSPHGPLGPEPLALTAELVDDFTRWSEAPTAGPRLPGLVDERLRNEEEAGRHVIAHEEGGLLLEVVEPVDGAPVVLAVEGVLGGRRHDGVEVRAGHDHAE